MLPPQVAEDVVTDDIEDVLIVGKYTTVVLKLTTLP
jgi:hypothetical protein